MRYFIAFAALSISLSCLGQVDTYEGYPFGVHLVAFSPDGSTLLMGSGSVKNTAHLFDVAKGEKVQELAKQKEGVAAGGWFPDGKRFYTSSGANGPLRFWSSHNEFKEFEFGACQYAAELIIQKEGKAYAIACDRKVYTYNADFEKQFEVDLDAVYATGAISNNGKELVVGNAFNELLFIGLEDASLEKTILDDLTAKHVKYLYTDELMVVDYYIFKTDEPYVRFINRGSGVETHFTDNDKILLAMAIPNQELVLTAHEGGLVKLYDKKGTLVKEFGKVGNTPLSMDINSSGTKAAIGLLNQLVLIDLSKF